MTVVSVWRARLAEGWCPREGHPAFTQHSATAGFCAECGTWGAWWTPPASSHWSEFLRVRVVGDGGRRSMVRAFEPLLLDRASRKMVVLMLDTVTQEISGMLGTP